MKWTELIICTSQSQKQQLQDLAVTFAEGFALEDYSDIEQEVQKITHTQSIEEELMRRPKDIVKLHLYYSPEENIAEKLQQVQAGLLAANIKHSLESKNIEQKNWETAWKKYYKPFNIGQRLAVVPSWEKYETARTIITLDPGMAFGTGTHETTYMCLEYLDALVKGGERMLDIGTGSGILAVAALLLGAQTATGVDIDPLSVRVAKENAQLNRVEKSFNICVGNLAQQASGKYNIISANIIADAIIQLAPAIPPLLAQNGFFVASGIIAQRSAAVETALQKAGLKISEIKSRKEWRTILCTN